MTRLKNYILPPEGVNEAAYAGNIGFEELTKFWKVASETQIEDMEEIIRSGDWKDFRILIKKVVGITLK